MHTIKDKVVKKIFVLLVPLAVTMIAAAPMADAQQNELNWTMDRAIRQLDRQGKDFETVLAEAEVAWIDASGATVRALKGRIYVNDKGDFRLNSTAPDTSTVMISGRTLYDYDPAAGSVKEYALSRHKNRLEVFIPLGFSITGKDLEKQFLVTFIGEQTMDSRRTLGLELTPKRDSMREVVRRIELWMDESSWLPVKQVIVAAAGGASMTASYQGTARNLSLNRDLFKADWPRGTERLKQ
jgi:outer membrane lipoprotein-sorting protein